MYGVDSVILCEYAWYVDVCKETNLCLVSPSTGVVCLRPRLGGEPPWFHNLCSFIAGLGLKPWTIEVCKVLPLHRIRAYYCIGNCNGGKVQFVCQVDYLY